jgi:hypothetical protein
MSKRKGGSPFLLPTPLLLLYFPPLPFLTLQLLLSGPVLLLTY